MMRSIAIFLIGLTLVCGLDTDNSVELSPSINNTGNIFIRALPGQITHKHHNLRSHKVMNALVEIDERENSGDKVYSTPCEKGSTPRHCICKSSCFHNVSGTQICRTDKCRAWNPSAEKCMKDSDDRLVGIILQGIPVTGTLGFGWGIIGRYDFIAIIYGSMGGVCILSCLMMCYTKDNDEDDDKSIGSQICSHALVCLLGLLYTVLWIYGIVVIATGDIDDGNGCPLVWKDTYVVN